MKNLIKKKSAIAASISLSICCFSLQAQETKKAANNGMMQSSKTMEKMTNESMIADSENRDMQNSMDMSKKMDNGSMVDRKMGAANGDMMVKMGMKGMMMAVPERAEDTTPLMRGEKIPAATLIDMSGMPFDLNKAVAEKPSILVFYRGGWCPYCNQQLSGLQKALPGLENLGFQIIAISTDAPEGLMKSSSKEKLSYTLLSDADLQVAKQFGIAYKAPKSYHQKLMKTTGGMNVDMLLPVPAVYVVNKKGTIQFDYVNPDIRERLSTKELLNAAANAMEKGSMNTGKMASLSE